MTRPDLDALAALLDKATPGHHPLSTAESAARHMANAKDEIVRALPALLAYVRELEREREPRPDLSGSTHWDIADAGAVCHDECAVAQIKGAALAMRERCAEICSKAARERTSDPTSWATAADCAAAIRALEP